MTIHYLLEYKEGQFLKNEWFFYNENWMIIASHEPPNPTIEEIIDLTESLPTKISREKGREYRLPYSTNGIMTIIIL